MTQCEDVQKRGVPCSKLRPREKSPQIWKPAFLTLGFSAAFSSDACSYREGGGRAHVDSMTPGEC